MSRTPDEALSQLEVLRKIHRALRQHHQFLDIGDGEYRLARVNSSATRTGTDYWVRDSRPEKEK